MFVGGGGSEEVCVGCGVRSPRKFQRVEQSVKVFHVIVLHFRLFMPMMS